MFESLFFSPQRRIVQALVVATLLAVNQGCAYAPFRVDSAPLPSPVPDVDSSLAILQGYTDNRVTWLAVLRPKDTGVLYEFYSLPAKGEAEPLSNTSTRVVTKEGKDSVWVLDQVEFSLDNSRPGQRFEMRVRRASGEILDRREFGFLDVKKISPRLVIASCLDDGFKEEQQLAWQKVEARKPDLILLLGDNVYADKYLSAGERLSPDEAILWRRHVETRSRLAVFKWQRLVPILAIWDDHDMGENDGDKSFPYLTESRETFRSFFPRPDRTEWLSSGPGLSFAFQAFGHNFLFLDNRSFRTTNRRQGAEQAHFGGAQEDWLFGEISRGAGPAWLLSGGQFFGGYHRFESFEGSHPDAFQRFLARLRRVRSPFLLVSGDRHMSELMALKKSDVGQSTFELTVSGLHARTYPDALRRNPNPRRIEGRSGPLNFAEITLRPAKSGALRAKVKVWGVREGLLYARDLTVGGRGK